MKSILLFIYLLFLSYDGFSQHILEVDGDVLMKGRLKLSYPFDTTSLAIGWGAGAWEDTSELRHNVFVGFNTGHFNQTGKYNTAYGANALYWNRTGNHQTAIGYLALYYTGFNNSESHFNTAVGALALTNTNTGIENTALGFKAGYSNQTGRWNTFIGTAAGRDLQAGDNNVFIGQGARVAGTGGDNNVVIGTTAGYFNNGSNNVFLGHSAGQMNLGSGNIFIGYEAAKNLTSGTDLLWIENSADNTPLIYGSFSDDRLGINCTNPQAALSVNGDIKAVGLIESNQAMACSSDIRFKKNISDLPSVSQLVKKLRPVRYEWKQRKYPEFHFSADLQIGFISQEVERLFPELILEGADGFKSMDYGRLSVVLIKAIQELHNKNQKLEEKYLSLVKRLLDLQAGAPESLPITMEDQATLKTWDTR